MQIIKAKDFAKDTTDLAYTKGVWSSGAMRHLIAALDGAQVFIVTDTQTGHMQSGVLTSIRYGGAGRSDLVRLVGEHNTTDLSLNSIGEIVDPTMFAKGKWDAKDSLRAEATRAIAHARTLLPDAPADSLGYSFEVTSFSDEVQVAWRVSRSGDGDKHDARRKAYARNEAGHFRFALREIEGGE